MVLDQVGEAPCSAMPNVVSLARQANCKRQKEHAAEPSDLEFELDTRNIPENFLKVDVEVGNHRHLIFSTDEMLSLLAKSKQWYI